MIRRGKAEGWLQLPSDALLPWAMLNDVSFDHAVPGYIKGRGGALLAKQDLVADGGELHALLTVPRDLILSVERVREYAKVDRDFREVLESLGDFGRTPRGAILSFLLVQASISIPDLSKPVGVHTPFSDYVKSLPMERLPTFWSSQELQLLIGTSLLPAISAKSKSLQREYDLLCSSAQQTRWYQFVGKHIDLDDWLQVDAMYRSRALDFPGIGHCTVPCIDLANHSAGDQTVAIYEKDADSNAVLLLRDGKRLVEDEEITITYGDEKGACEMLFSYGFLDQDMESAGTLFLGLNFPSHDTFRVAKTRIADCAPGFKIVDGTAGGIGWEGDFVWLFCVNEEDDLRFELARTTDGKDEEMQALFRGHEITGGAAELRGLLATTELWDVYQLRAITILQQRVFEQLQVLFTSRENVEAVDHGSGTEVQSDTFAMAMQLRQLEFALLEKAYEWYENKKLALAESPVVIRYLAQMQDRTPTSSEGDSDGDGDRDAEDFS